MDFLKKYNFNEEQIENIKNKYDDDSIDSLILIQDNVEEVLEYLINFGIKDVYKLMLDRIDIFFIKKDVIEELFSKYEAESIIATIDYDSSMFDEII